jgi:hypothetical protein
MEKSQLIQRNVIPLLKYFHGGLISVTDDPGGILKTRCGLVLSGLLFQMLMGATEQVFILHMVRKTEFRLPDLQTLGCSKFNMV